MPTPSPAVKEIKLSQRLGEVVKKARQDLGLSQPELAKQTGLSKSYISYLESGKYDEIGIAKLALLVDALELSADQLLTEAGYLNRPSSAPPKASRYLATQFGLDQSQLRSALDYLTFLQEQNGNRTRKR